MILFRKIYNDLHSFLWQLWYLPAIPVNGIYKVISLGLGQQSTTRYLMSSIGEIERADVAIFSDPGAESKETYKHLAWLKKWAKQNNGIPILHIGKKSLYRDLIHGKAGSGKSFASIPAFTKDEHGKTGILQRQCTEDYKISEINKILRKIYRLKAHQRTLQTEMWMGITMEEIERMKYPRTNWLAFVYPFLNIRAKKGGHEKIIYTKLFRRSDCQEWLRANNFPVPPKSACIFCPFQSDQRWLNMKLNQPKEWKKVLELDNHIRNSTKKGVKQPIYLHRSCKPLKDVCLQENQLELFNAECNGVCGI